MNKRINIFDVFNYMFLGMFAILVIIPIWHIIVISTSSMEVYVNDPYHMVMKSFNLGEYKRAIFDIGGILNSLIVTIKVTLLGTTVSMILTTMGAYVLSKKHLPGGKIIFKLILFTMFFNGGLVPFYILIKKLNFIDTIFALTIPLAISTYNLIIMKNYFLGLPESLEEAAKIDGYNDIQILFKIIIPISKPVIAAISLFYGVAYWNDYFMATLFINSNDMFPLQVVLRQMIIQNLVLAKVGVASTASNPEQFKMACIIVGIIPVLCIYPFIQKYFSKGVLLGAVKE
jgi:putative aldouronate transport system permease protein